MQIANPKTHQEHGHIREFSGIPANLQSLQFLAGIPGNFEDFPKLSFFWILMVPYYAQVFSSS